MKNKRKILTFLLMFIYLFCILNSCKVKKMIKNDNLAKDLFHSLIDANRGSGCDQLNQVLKAGADPDYCIGRYGWDDSNPLSVSAGTIYITYLMKEKGEEIPNPAPDVEAVNILVNAGADIKKRPYVWLRVFSYDDYVFDIIERNRKADKKSTKPEDMKEEIESFVGDTNRVLEALIEAGADPDMKGHPIPFNYEGREQGMDDEKAQKYFENGSRPINLAIEKGILWESQVDLLLKYVQLDEESLKAAKRAKDPAMIEKIEQLWAEQQTGRK